MVEEASEVEEERGSHRRDRFRGWRGERKVSLAGSRVRQRVRGRRVRVG